MSPISILPEELLLHIFSHLDSPCPSLLKARQEPSLNLTSRNDGETTDYKSISLVSISWRRIILPSLFAHSRIRLDNSDSEGQALDERREHHQSRFLGSEITTTRHNPSPSKNTTDQQYPDSIAQVLSSFLKFIVSNSLGPKVQSVVVLTDRMTQWQNRFPHLVVANAFHRYQASAKFWQDLLVALIGLVKVVILAPPAELACLTNCAIDLSGDWAFDDMDFHILSLSMPKVSSLPSTNRSSSLVTSTVPSEYPGVADASVLKLQPWTDLALNEGSFLKAYGTYEYFERGPPSLIYSIKDCLATRRHSPASIDMNSLRSFTYTAILPFANHLDFRGFLPYIEELDVQIAPDLESGILDDKDRVGKAELEDTWAEFFQGYRFITRPLRTFDIRPEFVKLKRFICRDVRIPALNAELDEEFVPLCLPVWSEPQPGVFERLQDAPNYAAEAVSI